MPTGFQIKKNGPAGSVEHRFGWSASREKRINERMSTGNKNTQTKTDGPAGKHQLRLVSLQPVKYG